MERIDIQNMAGVPKIFNLPHQQVCVKAGVCFCDHKNGACSSLHIPAKGRARHVDQAVLFADEIRAEVEAHQLLVYPSKRDFVPAQQQVAVKKQDTNKSAGSRKSARKGKTSKE